MIGQQNAARAGVMAGGIFIVDHTKIIDRYPEPESLAEIGDSYRSNGGGPFNLLVDLAYAVVDSRIVLA